MSISDGGVGNGGPSESAMGLKSEFAGQAAGVAAPRATWRPPGASESDRDWKEAAGERLDQIAGCLRDIYVTLENLRVTLEVVTRRADDHEQRLRRLEVWKHRVQALITVAAFGLGAAITAFVERWP